MQRAEIKLIFCAVFRAHPLFDAGVLRLVDALIDPSAEACAYDLPDQFAGDIKPRYLRLAIDYYSYGVLHRMVQMEPRILREIGIQATLKNEPKIVEWTIAQRPGDRLFQQSIGHVAALNNRVDILRLLDISSLSSRAIVTACRHGWIDTVKYLVDAGWIWDVEHSKERCIKVASTHGHAALARWLQNH